MQSSADNIELFTNACHQRVSHFNIRPNLV